MISRKLCPQCKKRAVLRSQYEINGLRFQAFECGHIEGRRQMSPADLAGIVSADGHKLRKFQIEGALFGIRSNCRFLLADEMGIGKTVQTAAILKSHEKDLCPVLWICKRALITQTARELMRWCGDNWIPQIIEAENQFILPGKAFIISYDMLWRFEDINAFMDRLKIQTIVMDEVQHLKNSSSKRTGGVITACKKVEHIAALSGTPIEKNSMEYFTILNILHPERFSKRTWFEDKHVQSYWDGNRMKYAGLKNPDLFKNETKDFILRRTRAEVLPDLPQISREFRFCELGDEVEEVYKNTLKEFQNYYNYSQDSAFLKQSNIMAYLSRMRHLAGISLINGCVDFVQDFVNETDRKIIIFVHHEDVGDKLADLIGSLEINGSGQHVKCVRIKAPVKQDLIELFRDSPEYRVAVITTLGGGEGLNLQFCQDMIMLERQWNPSKEEQAEGRIVRIGQQGSKLTATYFIAVGTVVEFFSEQVEKKRANVSNTLDFTNIKWDESSLVQELAEILAMKGGQKWGW